MRRQADRSRPLYRQVADDIREKIETGAWPPGTKLPSERSLCDLHSVSQITVRRSLRELEHDGLVYSRHGVGWFVSDEPPLPAGGPHVAGPDVTLVVPSLDEIMARVIQHLVSGLGDEGVPVHLSFTDGDAERQRATVARWQRQASRPDEARHVLILAPCGDARRVVDELTPALKRLGQPAALLLAQLPDGNASGELPGVALDEALCVQKVTQHLLHLGHRRLAYLGEDPSNPSGRQHYWGFTTSLWEEGLELPLDWVFTAPLWNDVSRGRQSDQGQRFDAVFRQSYHPTALVCASDLYAAEALSLLTSLGLRCPDDVALVGLGDYAFSPYLATPLTSLQYDVDELLRAAMRMALDLLAGRPVSPVVVSGTVQVRKSCGARR